MSTKSNVIDISTATNVNPADDLPGLERAIDRARETLISHQTDTGYWCYELEADSTIPAEYILMMHYMDEINEELQAKIANYLRDKQEDKGGWSLYYDGPFDISGSVKAYYALKLAGDAPDAPHMKKARKQILAHGGAETSNVFTRIALAMFEQLPWRATPVVPVEIVLFPKWFPFNLLKVSYWSRTVTVPLSILCSLKARARNPLGIGISELFKTPPDQVKCYFKSNNFIQRTFLFLDRVGFHIEPYIPKWIRNRAIKKAEKWTIDRLNGEDGLGAIFPAMVNAYEAMDLLGYPEDDPHRLIAKKSIDKLLVINEDSAYCQPCVSPVWDTGLAALALQEAGGEGSEASIKNGLEWLKKNQLLEEKGDWSELRPELRGGGWPFQFRNDYYPDLDDTAVVAWAMHDTQDDYYQENVSRAAEWLEGMQSTNGGFASFEIDNDSYILNEVPFADHGALLDPPSVDVSARVVTLFGKLNKSGASYEASMRRCIDYLRKEQEDFGGWYGRWGNNYIYGTWSVLVALEQAGISKTDSMVLQAVAWLKACQREDGGWGEHNDSYDDIALAGKGAKFSTAYQTAWAMLGLMAAGETDTPELARAADYLLKKQDEDGLWSGPDFTAPGFPMVFHLKYHGYDKFFPFWALARYRNLKIANGQ